MSLIDSFFFDGMNIFEERRSDEDIGLGDVLHDRVNAIRNILR
jgi:hypothetical protein